MDTGAPSFFWRAHTVTVLLVLICVLVYKGLIETPVEVTLLIGQYSIQGDDQLVTHKV